MPAKKRKGTRMQLSDEERERRRAKAKELVAKGVLGGPRPGSGRPRTRGSKLVADAALANSQKLVRVFKDSVDPSQPMRTRLAGATKWVEIEQKERLLELQEQERYEAMHRDDLIMMLAAKLGQLADSGVIELPGVNGSEVRLNLPPDHGPVGLQESQRALPSPNGDPG